MFTKADIEAYFLAEKNTSLLFIIIGAAAIILAAVFFFFLKTGWHKGAAVPLLLVGLIHLIIAINVYKRCDEQRKQNVYAYDMNVSELRDKELPRIEKVNDNFTKLKYAELALIVVGLILFYLFNNNHIKQFWAGFGIALVIEVALTFGAGYISHLRSIEYMNGLEQFILKRK